MRSHWMLGTVIGLTVVACSPQSAQPTLYDDDSSIKEQVQPYIQRGVNYLKASQFRNGAWEFLRTRDASNPQVVGCTALCGIALLECGVPANDPAVKRAYDFVRGAVSQTNYNYNYGVCLAIMFLDRYAKAMPRNLDVDLIKRLTEMVVRGQLRNGGWSYNLPSTTSDNSNTQFGVVALWIARKYKIRGVDVALARSDKKFRGSQRDDGGWGYDVNSGVDDAGGAGLGKGAGGGGITYPSMTCAGILGIALNAGMIRENQASFKERGNNAEVTDVFDQLYSDPGVNKAKAYLVRVLTKYAEGKPPNFHNTYFWWSLERVCKLYKWRKIDGLDWFAIGARYLMPLQTPQGSWAIDPTVHGEPVDTAFALLFLAQSNLLGDLADADFKGGALSNAPKIVKPSEKTGAEAKAIEPEQHAKELIKKLLSARTDERGDILADIEFGKGSHYTYELSKAISMMPTNEAKEMARHTLAQRMKRLTLSTLGSYFQQDDAELKIAAARACGQKNDKEAVPMLIPVLAELDSGVKTAAYDALKSLSGEDYRFSIERWSKWWESTKKK